ncbi:hypothetical protein MNBD_NITROSPINAE04-2197 [hydrothermal vent metagenome]|uniref:Uncharacterized protein n=1 Tax=hydrothermal vent metagenome TaxID=652676 RepID=A0A3B1BXS7_9ZZZZ
MSKKNKSSKRINEKKIKHGKANSLLYVAGALFILLAAFIGLRPFGLAEGPSPVTDPATIAYLEKVKKAGLVETRPLVPSRRYDGRVAQAYKNAAKIPEALDSIYCYCKCKENPRFRHKNLLTCFTDDHASKCGICLSQFNMAWSMSKEGKSIKEIRVAEDNYFGKRS